MTRASPKPLRAGELASYLAESRGLERDYIGELVHSRRWAWRVAGGCGILALLGLGLGIAGLAQPPAPPVVLRVDNATGAVERVTLMTAEETSYGEVVDTYWLNQYVLHRESYDYNTLQLNYDTTALLSAPAVQREYYRLYEGSEARDQVLADRVRITVRIQSIQPNGQGQATVRFSTQETSPNGITPPRQHRIATIAYTYVNGPMQAGDRRMNPLGFQVTSYRTDPEILSGN